MFIKISNLRDGEYFYKFNEPVSEVGLEKSFYNNFSARVKVSKSHNQIILDADLKANAVFECDRCTSDYKTEIITSYRMVYLFSKDFEESDSINITYLPVDADRINLSEDFRDYLMLAVPMKKLCKESCKGLCAKCGKDLNESDCGCGTNEVDARWLPLIELKNKLSTN